MRGKKLHKYWLCPSLLPFKTLVRAWNIVWTLPYNVVFLPHLALFPQRSALSEITRFRGGDKTQKIPVDSYLWRANVTWICPRNGGWPGVIFASVAGRVDQLIIGIDLAVVAHIWNETNRTWNEHLANCHVVWWWIINCANASDSENFLASFSISKRRLNETKIFVGSISPLFYRKEMFRFILKALFFQGELFSFNAHTCTQEGIALESRKVRVKKPWNSASIKH